MWRLNFAWSPFPEIIRNVVVCPTPPHSPALLFTASSKSHADYHLCERDVTEEYGRNYLIIYLGATSCSGPDKNSPKQPTQFRVFHDYISWIRGAHRAVNAAADSVQGHRKQYRELPTHFLHKLEEILCGLLNAKGINRNLLHVFSRLWLKLIIYLYPTAVGFSVNLLDLIWFRADGNNVLSSQNTWKFSFFSLFKK